VYHKTLFWVHSYSIFLSMPLIIAFHNTDDTTTHAGAVSPTVLEFIVNNNLKTLSSWFKDKNYLSINDTKTQALSLGPCKYNMKNAKIEHIIYIVLSWNKKIASVAILIGN